MWSTRIPRKIYARLYAGWKRVRREAEILEALLKRHGAREVVEFGCGVGRHGYLLSKRGFDVLLTDVKDWRHGVARRIRFARYDVLEGGSVGLFDAGYAMGLIILFPFEDMVRALRNIGGSIRRGGVFIFDYNFAAYQDTEQVVVRVNGRSYRAVLKKNIYRKVDGMMLYEYRVEVFDDKMRLVGVEDTSYPVYPRETVLKAVEMAGYELSEIFWASWDPVEYIYRPSEEEADSAFIVARKP